MVLAADLLDVRSDRLQAPLGHATLTLLSGRQAASRWSYQMIIDCPVATKELGETVPGELVAIPNDNEVADLAVIIHKLEDGHVHFAVLRSGIEQYPKPFHTTTDSTRLCASYGTEWVLSALPDDDGRDFGDQRLRDVAGSLAVNGDTVLIRLGRDPYNIRSTGGFFDLQTQKAHHHPQPDSVYVGAWSIWRSAEEMTDFRSVPLYSYIAREDA